MNVDDAFRQICDALNDTTSYSLDEGGKAAVRKWCEGTTRDGDPRPDVISGEIGDELVLDLCKMVREAAGPLIYAANAAIQRLQRRNGTTISETVVHVVAKVFSLSRTRLCDP